MAGHEHLPLIGAHTSAAGGVHKALLHGQSIGATTIQLFTSNQKQWASKPIADAEVERWQREKRATGLQHIMSHDSYLINLGSVKPDLLEKSIQAFSRELSRCHQLDIAYLNFHPGAATAAPREECLDRIVQSLLLIAPQTKEGKTRLLLECTAGQGSTVGWQFADLGYIIRHTHKDLPIGVCIDTCHAFSAGYDIRTLKGWEATLEQFEKEVGLQHLYAMHLNDSKHDLGARKDRHEGLGKGKIGIESFKVTMTHPHLRHLPKYLETPYPEKWAEEIALLKSFAHEHTMHS